MYDLNPRQKEVLTCTDSPLLVFAGAGSGKTKVLAHKFSYLHKTKRYRQDSIFTITQTNKATAEMKDQICSLISKDLNCPWIGTFYLLCNRILRKDIKSLGYKNNFSIYDEDDQYNLIRYILKAFKIHEALYRGFSARISLLKSSLIGPDEFLSSGNGFGFDEKLAKVYVRYQDELMRSNAVDCDDLIMLTMKLLEHNPRLLKKYQDRFSYILVDDFQDTNFAQYQLIKLLASAREKICVMGDDDQSIYKFRGANLKNIMHFEEDFPRTKRIKLEQNYRSTQHILSVSTSLIAHNSKRKNRKLWTDNNLGEKVQFCWFNTYVDEAKYIAKAIKEYYLKGTYNYSDFGIFYRVPLQSRMIEDALHDEGMPYQVVGCVNFYQKKEIKDILAYMRLSVNNKDNVSFKRIINSLQQKLNSANLTKIEHEAKKKYLALFDVLKSTLRSGIFTQTTKENLNKFIKFIERLTSSKYRYASDMLRNILEKTNLGENLDNTKLSNIEELIFSAEGKTINEFLDRVSLSTSIDEANKGNAISLMTLYCTRGYEFPIVFIIGLEDGILPYCKALKNEDELSEERRLLYVGMTRAKDILWLTGAGKRKLYSKVQEQEPSRFLEDIPKECCNWIEKVKGHRIIRPAHIKKNMRTKEAISFYTAGCRVKHPAWGTGVVRDCYGNGDDLKVMVNFADFGIKRLAIKFANLKRI